MLEEHPVGFVSVKFAPTMYSQCLAFNLNIGAIGCGSPNS